MIEKVKKVVFLLLLIFIFGQKTTAQSLKVLFICSDIASNSLDAQWSDILKDFKIECELIGKGYLTIESFIGKDLIIIGSGTADKPKSSNIKWFDYWGDQDKVDLITAAGLPILGISFGGMCLFGQMNLPIGGGHFAHGKGKTFLMTEAGKGYLRNPYIVVSGKKSILNLSSRDQGWDGMFKPPKSIEPIAQVIDSRNYFTIVRYKDFVVWGCGSNPKHLSNEGKGLFANIVHSLSKKDVIATIESTNKTEPLPLPTSKSSLPKWQKLLSGLHINIGYSGSFWSLNIESPMKVKTHGTQLGYFEAWYSNTLIKIGEMLRILDEPYIFLQTDFGTKTSSELISIAEPSSVRPQGNLKLLMQINVINPLFFRYQKETFVAELFSEQAFNFIPYEGELSVIPSESRLYMVSDFNDTEFGVLLRPEDHRIEFGAYHAVWQRPRAFRVSDANTGEFMYYNVYDAMQDFWGGMAGYFAVKEIYKNDELVRSYDWGISGKLGWGKMKLSSRHDLTSESIEAGNNNAFVHTEFNVRGRYYWRFISAFDVGLDFKYIFRRVTLTSQHENPDPEGGNFYVLTEDSIFLISLLTQFAP